jgi:AcrR family transcriptional regulator
MAKGRSRPDNLREACVAEAMAIIERRGVEELSLRDVARRLGVSHQAPYRHFPSRDHLLAEVVSRCYRAFADHLEARPRTGDPEQDLGAMGVAYIEYAMAHPLQYRLMFSTPLPDPSEHPQMMTDARQAFALLQEGIDALHSVHRGPGPHGRTDGDALSVWFTLHGMVSAMPTRVMDTLNVATRDPAAIGAAVLERIGWMLGGDDRPAG